VSQFITLYLQPSAVSPHSSLTAVKAHSACSSNLTGHRAS